RPVGRPRALPADAGGGVAEAPQERGRGSLRQGPLRGRRPDLPRHDRCAQVRGVPDAPGLRQGGRRGQVIGGYYNLDIPPCVLRLTTPRGRGSGEEIFFGSPPNILMLSRARKRASRSTQRAPYSRRATSG